MADRTSDDNEITREEFASNLRVIADAFEDDGDVDSDVENKTISLHPPDVIEYEIAVCEGSSVIGSDSERVSIEAEWTPENRSRRRPRNARYANRAGRRYSFSRPRLPRWVPVASSERARDRGRRLFDSGGRGRATSRGSLRATSRTRPEVVAVRSVRRGP